MLLSSCIGVSCSPSGIKAVQVYHRGGVVVRTQAQAVPLPLGCIHERSGDIEDSHALQTAIQGIPLLSPRLIQACRVSIALPQACSYTATWDVAGLGRVLTPEEIRQRCDLELPGRLSSLCIDAHQQINGVGGSVRVMLVAVRRDVVERYRRIFSGERRHIVRVTTDDISRYNSALSADSSIYDQKVLLVWFGKRRVELAVWDRGFRVAHCSLGLDRTASPHSNYQQAKQALNAATAPLNDLLREAALSVDKLISEERGRSKPVDRIVLHGMRAEDRLNRAAFEAVLDGQASLTWLTPAVACTADLSAVSVAAGSQGALDDFEDALGAVIPELISFRESKECVWGRFRAASHRWMQTGYWAAN